MQEASKLQVLPQVSVNVRAARKAAGLTQEQLARAVDVTLTTIRNWEATGDRARLPSGRNLLALSRVLERHPSWFYAEHDDPGDEVAA